MEIRKARMTDVKDIHCIVNEFAKEHLMLSRSLYDIYDTLRDFWIVEDSGSVIGCAALKISWEDLAEVKSLAVDKSHQQRGAGRRLVQACLNEARELGIHRVFALTYQVDFFKRLDFKIIEKETLPHKIWSECINCYKFPDCDETAMQLIL
ncbi:MAG: N-acetyltransferase [Candidatus Theseobacter exili]|nr:N-acetyltransferase [Candidatus Theseobacter exili]